MSGNDRYSVAELPKLITDKKALAAQEAANALRQFDQARAEIQTGIERSPKYRLRPSLITTLHRTAVEGVETFAGVYRPGPVSIVKSNHVPPDASRVQELVEDLCEYVNENWTTIPPVDLSAYVLWRICWIHPFTDGNGRTARIVSYIVLSVAQGFELPGTNVIPNQIEANKRPYYDALDAIDESEKSGEVDVSAMREMFKDMIALQLVELHDIATGQDSVDSTEA